MTAITIIVVLFILAALCDEFGSSCVTGLIQIIFGIIIVGVAFALNPILGIIAIYCIYKYLQSL